jgi:hypothetical protein
MALLDLTRLSSSKCEGSIPVSFRKQGTAGGIVEVLSVTLVTTGKIPSCTRLPGRRRPGGMGWSDSEEADRHAEPKVE